MKKEDLFQKTKTDLIQRVQELAKAVNESAENHQKIRTALDNATHAHNALVGRLDEARDLHNKIAVSDNESTPIA